MIATATLLSSAVRFFRVTDAAGLHVPDLVDGIKARYRFWDAPKGPAEFDLSAGARFAVGMYRDVRIESLQLYANGVHVQGNANTVLLDGLVDDLLLWLETEFDVKCESGHPVEKLFLSALEVSTEKDLASKFEWLSWLADELSEMMQKYGFVDAPYRVTSIALSTDTTVAKPPQIPRFVFERRANIPHSENLFYSEAPVSTEEHVALLESLELSL
jgi:hypothetical protein